MILVYTYPGGTYTHGSATDAEIYVANMSRTNHLSQQGFQSKATVQWTVRGVKQADTETDLKTILDALESVYTNHGGDWQLFWNDGTTLASQITSAAFIGGLWVDSFRYPEGNGTEFVPAAKGRSFEITMKGILNTNEKELLAWQETLTGIGTTGPKRVFLQTLNGPPQEQFTTQQTTSKVIQTGYALGYSTWPSPAPPKFPAFEHLPERAISYGTPKYFRGTSTEFPVRWTYNFESTTLLTGFPTDPPA